MEDSNEVVNFGYVSLKAAGDPAWLYTHLGFTPENAYGFRTEEDGTHTLVVKTEDLPRVTQAVAEYDNLVLEHLLKPAALERAWVLRKQNMSQMKVVDRVMQLDDTTLNRLTQAKNLLDEADKRGYPLTQIDWELVKGTFVTWAAQLVKDTAFLAGLHVQQTFSYQKSLYLQIRAASTIDALRSLDLEAGWPNQ